MIFEKRHMKEKKGIAEMNFDIFNIFVFVRVAANHRYVICKRNR